MEVVIIVLVAINCLIVLYLLANGKSKEQSLENFLLKNLGEINERQKHYQSQELQSLRESLDRRIGEGLENSRKTIGEVMERLVRVDSAQKQIAGLSQSVNHLQDVLTDKKTRGIFGEVQLTNILTNVFGENRGRVYDLQYTFSNQRIADAVLFLPEPLGTLAVDSKFPLENYQRMINEKASESERLQSQKEFSKNLKKHIDDISSKYILKNETADQAIMFLPAEAIFSQIHAYHQEVVEYAAKKRVWITSPTTFLAIITTVQSVLRNLERTNHMEEIRQELEKLEDDFSRFDERWNDLDKHIGTVFKDVEKLHVSQRKISERFKKIIHIN